MKSKQLILGSMVFVFAIGSAFASLLAPQTIYVNALVDRPSGPNPECVPLQQNCDDSGGEACTVLLETDQGLEQTSSTYSDSGCTMPLFNTSTEVIPSSPEEDIEIIQLLEPNN